jgi:hypothetical protein
MFPALTKPGFSIKLNSSVSDETYSRIYNKMKHIFNDLMDRFTPSDYSLLHSEYRDHISKSLKEWVQYQIRLGELVPDLKEESRRFGFKIEEVAAVNIITGNTESNQFEAEILVVTETLTIVGTIGDKVIFTYGDVTGDIKQRKSASLYQLDSNTISWYEEYQSVQL